MEQDIINTFQHEFGRLLSPMELEIINDWKSQGFENDKIREALKQSVFNGALSLRYISKILQSWKSKDEVENVINQDLSWLE